MSAPSLVDFLLARIAEDAEQAAKAVGRGIMWPRLADGVAAHDVESGWHVFRWHPARVLAECEAKRRIVERAQRASAAFDQSINPTMSGVAMTMDLVLRDLALSYADHEDYREEWRP